jgi:hypothetical protein
MSDGRSTLNDSKTGRSSRDVRAITVSGVRQFDDLYVTSARVVGGDDSAAAH